MKNLRHFFLYWQDETKYLDAVNEAATLRADFQKLKESQAQEEQKAIKLLESKLYEARNLNDAIEEQKDKLELELKVCHIRRIPFN